MSETESVQAEITRKDFGDELEAVRWVEGHQRPPRVGPEPFVLLSKHCGGWVKLWTREGAHVTLPVTEQPMDYPAMLANVSKMLAAGFLVEAPGLVAGEYKLSVGWVVRKSKTNKDGSESPMLDLYDVDESKSFAVLSLYLDRPEDIAAFEYASGLKLESMPLYIGDNKIERGKAQKTDQFLVRPSKPFTAIYIDNPAWKKEDYEACVKRQETYKVAKRKFVRWADQKPASGPAETPEGTKTPIGKVKEWADWLAGDPSLDELNAAIPRIKGYDKDTSKAVWDLVIEHAKKCCAIWNKERKCYEMVDPQTYAQQTRSVPK